jgi:transcriptional regulator with XRE-family HTH domain
MPLKKEYLRKLKTNIALKKNVCELLGVSRQTMAEYLNNNHANLTRYTVLTAIASEYNTSVENIIEPVNPTK